MGYGSLVAQVRLDWHQIVVGISGVYDFTRELKR